MNVLAICAGVGGLELGLQLAHHHRGQAVRGVCYVEREAGAAASLVASMEAGWLHHAPVWSDARTFDGAAWRGCVDIVTSGDPCQGNSVAGKRRGELDDRWLLDRAIDIFDASGAHTFFRENVPGNADGQLAVAIPALERLGCRIAVGIFSSAETGNTMRRERLFILAHRDGFQSGADGGRSNAQADGRHDISGCRDRRDGQHVARPNGSRLSRAGSEPKPGCVREQSGPNMRGSKGDVPLPAQAMNWAGPAAQNHKGSSEGSIIRQDGKSRADILSYQAEQFFHPPSSPDHPTIAAGSTSSTDSPNSNQLSVKRKLNPIFVEALMRWPTGLSGFERQEMAWTRWWQLMPTFLSMLVSPQIEAEQQLELL